MHGEDYSLFVDTTPKRGGEDCKSNSDEESESDSESESGDDSDALPDLFDLNLKAFPQLRKARLYKGTQNEGDICFNPSKCIHAVVNLEDTVSLTHNFVGPSNICHAVEDACRSFEEEVWFAFFAAILIYYTNCYFLACTASPNDEEAVEL